MPLNQLTSPILLNVRGLTILESLDLSKSELAGEIPPGLASLGFQNYFGTGSSEGFRREDTSPRFQELPSQASKNCAAVVLIFFLFGAKHGDVTAGEGSITLSLAAPLMTLKGSLVGVESDSCHELTLHRLISENNIIIYRNFIRINNIKKLV